MNQNPTPANKELFPPFKIPAHIIDEDYNVTWIEPADKIKFKKEDIAGLSYWSYGAVWVVLIESGAESIKKWNIFFHNYLNAEPRSVFEDSKTIAAFYVDPAKFRDAIQAENMAARLMRRENENTIEMDSKEYTREFFENLPMKSVDERIYEGLMDTKKYENPFRKF